MGARGWAVGMAVAMTTGVVLSCVGLLAPLPVMMWVAPAPYLLGFVCCVRMLDHLGAGADGDARFSWLGWLRD